jgi:hypothetical protein
MNPPSEVTFSRTVAVEADGDVDGEPAGGVEGGSDDAGGCDEGGALGAVGAVGALPQPTTMTTDAASAATRARRADIETPQR